MVIRRRLLVVLSCIAALCFMMTAVFMVKPVSAESTASVSADAFYVQDSASIRYGKDDMPFGLRFNVVLGSEKRQSLTAENTRLGVIIIPEEYYTAYKSSATSDLVGYLNAEEDGRMVDLYLSEKDEESRWIEAGVQSDGSYIVGAAIQNVLFNNVNMNFVAIGYIKTDDVFEYTEEADARSIATVAKAARDASDFDPDVPEQQEFLNNTIKQAFYQAQGVKEEDGKYSFGGSTYDTFDAAPVESVMVELDKQSVELKVAEINDGDITSDVVTASVSKYGETVKDATVTWSVNDESDVVTVDNGTITAKKAGQATVTATYTYDGEKTATATVNVVVSKSTVDGSAYNLGDIETTRSTEIDMKALGVENYNGEVALKADEVSNDAQAANGKVSLSAEGLEEGQSHNVTIELNDRIIENVPLFAVSVIIRDMTDLNNMRRVKVIAGDQNTANQYGGYIVLGNDINAEGSAYTPTTALLALGNSGSGFLGTFDGRGHTIYDINMGTESLFGNISGGGVVKNLSIANASCIGTGDEGGLLALKLYDGTIENCDLSLTLNERLGSFSAIACAVGDSKSIKVKDVVVEVDDSAVTGNLPVVGWLRGSVPPVFDNVYVIAVNTPVGNENITQEGNGLICKAYSEVTAETFSDLNEEYWDSELGIPMFKSDLTYYSRVFEKNYYEKAADEISFDEVTIGYRAKIGATINLTYKETSTHPKEIVMDGYTDVLSGTVEKGKALELKKYYSRLDPIAFDDSDYFFGPWGGWTTHANSGNMQCTAKSIEKEIAGVSGAYKMITYANHDEWYGRFNLSHKDGNLTTNIASKGYKTIKFDIYMTGSNNLSIATGDSNPALNVNNSTFAEHEDFIRIYDKDSGERVSTALQTDKWYTVVVSVVYCANHAVPVMFYTNRSNGAALYFANLSISTETIENVVPA